MDYLTFIKYTLIIPNLLLVAPFIVKNNKIIVKKFFLYLLIIEFCVIILLIIISIYLYNMGHIGEFNPGYFKGSPQLSRTIAYIDFTSIFIVYAADIISMHFYKNDHIELIYLIKEIDDMILKKFNKKIDYRLYCIGNIIRWIILISIYLTLQSILFIKFYYNPIIKFEIIFSLVFYNIATLTTLFTSVLYVMFVNIIRNRSVMLTEIINDYYENNKIKTLEFIETAVFCYLNLCQSITLTNKIFSITHLFMYIHDSVLNTVQLIILYWIVYVEINNDESKYIPYISISIILLIYKYISISAVTEVGVSKIKELESVFNRAYGNISHSSNFISHLKFHNEINYTANGYFSINAQYLFSMMASTVTFFIIFTQFRMYELESQTVSSFYNFTEN